MVDAGAVRSQVDDMIGQGGEVLRFRHYVTSGADAGYDDDVSVTPSGAISFVSGLVQPIDTPKGSFERNLVEQGKLKASDIRVFVNGTVDTADKLKVSLGSPSYVEHFLLEDGVNRWSLGGESVYKKIYLRILTNGSFVGE